MKPAKENLFTVFQHTDIAQYVIENAPSFTRNCQLKQPRAFNPEPVLPIKKSETEIPQNPFLTTIALAVDVADKCFEERQYVNAFFHNLLTHFAFIFLDPKQGTLSQILSMQEKIRKGKTSEVIFILQKNHYRVLQTLEFVSCMLCVNPGNKRIPGGVVTYNKGTDTDVEEALARVSNLFLNQLLYHATDSYQRKILQSLLNAFEKMLTTGNPLLQTQVDCYEHAAKWVPLMYKTDKNGYYISPQNIHEHPVIFFIDKNKLPSLAELRGMDDEGNFCGKETLRDQFFTNCRVAAVLDVVCKNNNWWHVTNDDDDASFQQIMDQVTTKMEQYKQSSPVNLVMPLIGAGYYQNAPKDVCAPFNNHPKQLIQHGCVTLLLQEDKILECIKILRPAAEKTPFHYNVSLSTIALWWNDLKLNISDSDVLFISEFNLMKHVIDYNQQILPPEKVQAFCRQELHAIYNSYVATNQHEKIIYTTKLCEALLGQAFAVNFRNWEQLLHILDGCVSHHPENFFTQVYYGNRGLITAIQTLKSSLCHNPPITAQDMKQHIEQVHAVIQQKHIAASKQTLTPALMKTFLDLENNLGDLAMAQEAENFALNTTSHP